MIKAFALSTQVSFTISCNYLIYYIKKIPFLGKKIPDSIYRHTAVKAILTVFVELAKVVVGFFGASLSLAIFIFGPMFLMQRNLYDLDLLYHYLFFIYFLVGPTATNIIVQTRDIKAYTMVRLLNLPGRDFFVPKVIYTLAIKTVRYLLLLLVMGLFIEISPLESLMLAGYILFAALIWEALLIKANAKSKTNLYDKTWLVFLWLFIVLLPCYLLPVLGVVLRIRVVLTNGFVFALMAGLAGVSLWKLYSFSGYSRLTRDTLSRERLLGIANTVKNITFADVNLKEEKLAQEKVAGDESLQGYALFNYLFFARHRQIIAKPVRTRTNIVAAVTLAVWGALILLPEMREGVRENILSLSQYFIFIMYLLSTGERFSRALFFNCDRYMLKERYYKDKEAVLHNFTVRLKKSIKSNLVPAAGIAILLLGAGVIAGMGWEIYKLLPTVITIFSLSVFFSTHYLFIYYILQPYTAELTKKSPLYSIVNFLIYFISWMFIQVSTTSYVFTFGVLLFTVVYTLVAIALTYNFAHKTFKLK